MRAPPHPRDEVARLETLREYEILDTAAEPAFDEITQLTAFVCGTPTALITLVDEKRQWFKSRIHWPTTETPREIAFCAFTIVQPELLIVPDAQLDQRFA